ncbi:MAG: hypothetical protein ACK56I_15395, partial [bacterium]
RKKGVKDGHNQKVFVSDPSDLSLSSLQLGFRLELFPFLPGTAKYRSVLHFSVAPWLHFSSNLC